MGGRFIRLVIRREHVWRIERPLHRVTFTVELIVSGGRASAGKRIGQ